MSSPPSAVPTLAAVRAAALLGVEAYHVTVEVHLAPGLPQFTVVGLPAGAVKESRERVTAALAHSGFGLPPRRITVNLAPADVRKDGTAFDLPIALGLLQAMGVVTGEAVARLVAVGELALDGTLRAVRGTLPIAAAAARDGHTLVLPPANVAEAGRVRAARLAAPATLAELVGWLRAGRLPAPPVGAPARAPAGGEDFADVVGQPIAKRALEIAAAGGHNALLVGPPGAGKTMLARRLPTILPPLDDPEALEVLAIRSVAGLPPLEGEVRRPFRAPHHTLSTAALVGGSSTPRPGEVTLAHHGVLFMDELLEVPRGVLDALRQPMEDGRVVVSRAAATVTFPARFTLVGAANPCPCGHAGDAAHPCRCAPGDAERYLGRLSGPVADRIDMHLRVGPVPPSALALPQPDGDSSATMRARVERARDRQRRRYRSLPGVACNAHAPHRWLDRHGDVHPDARTLLVRAADRLALSARTFHRLLRVARTAADLDDEREVGPAHLAEALRFRPAGACLDEEGLARPPLAARA